MLSVLETKAKMKGKPVIVSLEMDKPTIMSEFEGSADAILVNFGVQNQAVLDIISGKAEPSALLPLQMPADMRIVEEQFEDVPRDMKCYTDSEGHLYDFTQYRRIVTTHEIIVYRVIDMSFFYRHKTNNSRFMKGYIPNVATRCFKRVIVILSQNGWIHDQRRDKFI